MRVLDKTLSHRPLGGHRHVRCHPRSSRIRYTTCAMLPQPSNDSDNTPSTSGRNSTVFHLLALGSSLVVTFPPACLPASWPVDHLQLQNHHAQHVIQDNRRYNLLHDMALQPDKAMMSAVQREMKEHHVPGRHAPSPDAIRALATALGVGEERAASMLQRAPPLAQLPAAELAGRLQHLEASLKLQAPRGGRGSGAGHAAAVDLAVRQPRVLLVEAGQVTERLQALGVLLQVPPEQAATAVRQQPGLLTHSPDTLRVRLEGVAQLLQLPESGVLGLLRREPGLLTLKHDELLAHVRALVRLFADLPPPPQEADKGPPGSPGADSSSADERAVRSAVLLARRAPGVLLLSPGGMQERAGGLGQLLQLPPQAVASLVLRAPHLLLLPPTAAEASLAAVASLLQVEPAQAAVVCTEQPLLLAVPHKVLRERMDVLAQVMGLPLDRLRLVLRERPVLLTKDSQAVQEAVQQAKSVGQLSSK